MKNKRQFIKAIAVMLMFTSVFLCRGNVYAAEKTVKIYTQEEEQDLTVVFSFDKEIVDITFLSPDDNKLTKTDKDVTYDSGDLWSSYTIKNAAKGDWRITYDPGSNKNLNYSVVESTTDETTAGNSTETQKEQSTAAKSKIDEGLSSSTSDNSETEITVQKIKPIEETQTSAEEENTDTTSSKKKSSSESKWVINEGDPRTTVIETYVGSGTTRFEVFYSANAQTPPEVTFLSASGNIYRKDSDVEYGNTVFVTRSGYIVSDYPDIKYDIIYIKGAEDPGTWKMSVTIDDHTNELFVVTSKVADGWETFETDYKTAPTDALLWYIDPKLSAYTVNDITSVIAKDTKIPETNSIQPYVEEEVEEQKNPIVGVLVLLSLAIVGGIVAIVLLYKKSQKESISNKKNAIAKANKRLKAKQKKENNSLDQVLATYEDEYKDDEVLFASFNSKKQFVNVEESLSPTTSQPQKSKEMNREAAEPVNTPVVRNERLKFVQEINHTAAPEEHAARQNVQQVVEEKEAATPSYKNNDNVSIPSWVDKSSMLDENSPAWKKPEKNAVTNFF